MSTQLLQPLPPVRQLPVGAGLVRELAEAAKSNDRERFDQLFETAFQLTYAMAWRLMGETALAEGLTAHVMKSALRSALEEDPDTQAAPAEADGVTLVISTKRGQTVGGRLAPESPGRHR